MPAGSSRGGFRIQLPPPGTGPTWHHLHDALFRAPMALAWNPDRCGFTPQPPAAEWHRTQSFCR
jgi:hypothetical protein